MDVTRLFEEAVGLHTSGRLTEARARYEAIIAAAPDHLDALHALGVVDLQEQRFADAAARFQACIARHPNFVMAHSNLAAAFLALDQPAEALASSERAIASAPDAAAYKNRAFALQQLARADDAVGAYEQALAIAPDDTQALVLLAKLLNTLGRHDEAACRADAALALAPDLTDALLARAVARQEQRKLDAALIDYEVALTSSPDMLFLPGETLQAAMRLCQWDGFEDKVHNILARIDAGELPCAPFPLMTMPSSGAQQRATATRFAASLKLPARSRCEVKRDGGKLRLGYFSGDYKDHAMSHLLNGLFAGHDRSRFEVIGFATEGDPRNAVRRQIAQDMDQLIDVAAMNDAQIIALAREKGIHIALDLNLYTGRLAAFFAARVAPVQVNYLGYPGTSGADYYDYLIADPVIAPPERRADFSERLVLMPHTYQVNSFRRYKEAPRDFTRRELGLPENGFVFCCFNTSVKLTPDIFAVWMRLMTAVEGSVLWLMDTNAATSRNLKREMQAHGVAPSRLVFASRMGLPEHMARHRCADLFLDTLHYGAHTTASDALWAGLPVVTRLGETFASRVCASLITAAGVPELITHTVEDYEALALALATNPEKLKAVKRRLVANRLSCPLFDTERYTRNLERAFERMWALHKSGQPPADFAVSD